jgi:hypothetical protein
MWHGGTSFYMRPETWISADALDPRRVVLTPDAEPGERMGERLLRPSALR